MKRLSCWCVVAVLAGTGLAAAETEAAELDFTHIKLETQGGVWIAKLDNPPKNLMNAPMVAEISQLMDAIEQDESVRALVFTGNMPGVFIQHYDVGELSTLSQAMVTAENFDPGDELHATHLAFLKIEQSRVPVIAAINGLCMGGGFELALACDIRFLAHSGVVGLPEAGVGILPGAGGTQRLPRLIGADRALELMLVGDVVGAERAAELGMVNRVIGDEALLGEAVLYAERIADMPPESVAAIKRIVREGMALPLEEALHVEQDAFWDVMASDAAQRLLKEYAEGGQNAEF